jgi:peptidase E
MTKYILIGGYLQKASDGGQAFVEEFVKDFQDRTTVRVLDCIFADPVQAEVKFQEDKERMSKFVPNLQMELADPKNFLEQVRVSDAIFFRGGDTDTLISTLKECGDWVSSLEGKTVAGTSAGAMALAKYSHALIKDRLTEGLGLVPVKVIAHWKSEIYEVDWEQALENLTNHKEDLPVYTLKEGEYVVLEQ